LILGLAAHSASAQLFLRGSDTLEDVTKDAIINAGLSAQITYLGGGSGAGEGALNAASQFIAPMSRQLNSGTAGGACSATATQLLVGLDGVAVIAASQRGDGDSTAGSAATTDDCTDDITGGFSVGSETVGGGQIFKADGTTPCDATTDGCTAAGGKYTFSSYKDVLALIYGGQNHNSGGALTTAGGAACTYSIDQTVKPANETGGDAACGAGLVCFPNNKCSAPGSVGNRVATRINCMNPVRVFLANNYGSIFHDNGTANSCRTGTCTTLRHAFRRDDLSGTTDAFASLVGLSSLPNQTKNWNANSPLVDRQATANAFCNAGDRIMNKSDGDYLDLDPIRRAIDFSSGTNKFGLEQVAEYNFDTSQQFSGNNDDTTCNVAGVIPTDHSSPVAPGLWPDPAYGTAAAKTFVLAELGSDGVGPKYNLDTPTATTRRCLGMVLPVTLPANYLTTQDAYFGDTTTGTPVICDQAGTAMAFVIADARHSQALCPNGGRQPCALPYHADVNAPNGLNFNCLSDKLNPTLSQFGYFDRRIFNLHPVGQDGHYKVDNYVNPNFCNEKSTSAYCAPTFAKGGPGTTCAANSDCATNNCDIPSGTCQPQLCATNADCPNGGIGVAKCNTAATPAVCVPPPQFTTANQARVVSGFYRMHTTRNTNLHGSVPTVAACLALTSTDQIGCLVKANSCSIGYAGRESVDDWATLGPPAGGTVKNFAFQIGETQPSIGAIQAFATHPVGVTPYNLARGLWLNSLSGGGLGGPGPANPPLSAAELSLWNWEATSNATHIDPIITARNFVVVPGSVVRQKSCPAVFP
jgi:hypothetical protein